MLPISLRSDTRNCRQAVRQKFLVSSVVNSDKAIVEILDELFNMTVSWVLTTLTDGEKAGAFLDVLKYTGDYRTAWHVIYYLGHNAAATSTLCSF